MNGWRTVWSMAGRWLVYIPSPQAARDVGHGPEQQLSFPPEFKAEAHMVGAAEDMLAALKALWAAPYDNYHGRDPAVDEQVRAVIAKAEGRA